MRTAVPSAPSLLAFVVFVAAGEVRGIVRLSAGSSPSEVRVQLVYTGDA